MKRLNKKGFTLIELLAVIIILGVLLLVAVPAMNGVIEKSKKDAFASNGKSYIGAVRYSFIQGDYPYPSAGTAAVVFVKELPLDQGAKGKSPYNAAMKSGQTYVVIYNNGNGTTGNKEEVFTYYYAGADDAGDCIPLTLENNIDYKVVHPRNSGTCPTDLNATTVGSTIKIPGVDGDVSVSYINSDYKG